jgi:hypothetical protein
MSRPAGRAGTLAIISSVLIVTFCGHAAAHEERHVNGFHFAVGFGEEPAYAGERNSVQLLLTDANGKPIVDLGSSLKVQVGYQAEKMAPLTMQPDFEIGESGTPGDYRAWFIPTRPGPYSFHFTGSIKGRKIDQTFKSGEKTFSSVEDPQGVEFPAKDPTSGQLSELLQRESARLSRTIETARSESSEDVTTARNFGLLGVGLGIIALVVAVFAVSRKSR